MKLALRTRNAVKHLSWNGRYERGFIYQIKCPECQLEYIVQTKYATADIKIIQKQLGVIMKIADVTIIY
jgi:ribosomal protein S27E